MAHPFFELGRYPFDLDEANNFYRMLYQTVRRPEDIELLYQQCGGRLNPLERQQPSLMWKAALEALAGARLLRVLGERLLERQELASVCTAFQAAADLPDTIQLPTMMGNRIFFDREVLREKIRQMETASGISVLLVRGEAKSGKTWTKYLIEEVARAWGDESLYLADGLIASVEEAVERIFSVLDGEVPPILTTDDAWFRTVCTQMAKLAKRNNRRYWIIADHLHILDEPVCRFFNQMGLEMQSPHFSRWFRLVLIDYPGEKVPTRWKGIWSEDAPSSSDVDVRAVSGYLLQWAAHNKKRGLESKAEQLASLLIARVKKPVAGDERPKLERIHDELIVLLPTL